MKTLALLLTLVSLCGSGINSAAQTPLPSAPSAQPSNVYAAGPSFNPTASPKIAGTALYARLASDGTGTYLFTVYDAIPTSTKQLSVTSNVGVGVAQKLFTIGKIPFYAPVAGGPSWTGSNIGWQWSGGILGAVRIKNNWHAYPSVRFSKSSVSNSGYQIIPTVLFGWQQ